MINMVNAKGKYAFFLIIAGALILGAAFLAATILLTSCSVSVSAVIKADGGAKISIQTETPAVLAGKFPAFDIASIRKSIVSKPGLSLVELAQPKPESIRVVVAARSIEELAGLPDLEGSGLISISHGPGWTECRFRLQRGNAKALAALYPDPYFWDALSPPALEEDPVTAAEYKTMLKSVFGGKAMPAIEAAVLTLTVSAPGPVIGYGGGTLSGSTLVAKIPTIEVITLEQPIELWLRWK
jgi:hypothetical protein